MKLPIFLRLYAILLMAAGIAFALYGPLMLPYFAVTLRVESAESYWYVASFARMFGAVLFGMGILVWSLRDAAASLPANTRRGLLSALLLANLIAAFVAITQQSSIWLTPAGWVMTAIFSFFLAASIYFMVQPAQKNPM